MVVSVEFKLLNGLAIINQYGKGKKGHQMKDENGYVVDVKMDNSNPKCRL